METVATKNGNRQSDVSIHSSSKYNLKDFMPRAHMQAIEMPQVLVGPSPYSLKLGK